MSLGVATIAALEAATAYPVVFVSLALDSGTERFHTGLGVINWGSNDWYGQGELASLDELVQQQGLKAAPIRLGLNSLSQDVLSALVDSGTDYYNRFVQIYLGALDANFDLVEDPGSIWTGYAQNLEYMFGAESESGSSASLTCESELINFSRAPQVRYTEAQLQSEYSTDLFFQYLDQVRDFKTVWRGRGNTRLAPGNPTLIPPNINPGLGPGSF